MDEEAKTYGDITGRLAAKLWSNAAIAATSDPLLMTGTPTWVAPQAMKTYPVPPPVVTTLATHELVMELIARGFAVAKLPAEELANDLG